MTPNVILVLAACPSDTPRLRLDTEVREIANGLQRARRRDEFILRHIWAPRPADVRRAMLDEKPKIVHFCGHGDGPAGLAFEDGLGGSRFVSGQTLGQFFSLFADEVDCIVLNACYSEIQADEIAKHIRYVIGMSKEIPDQAAIEFSVAFYDALGAGETIDFAFQLACNAIDWLGLPDSLTPVLKTRSPTTRESSIVFDSREEEGSANWTLFSTGGFAGQIARFQLEGKVGLRLQAFTNESVGVNKSLPFLFGRIEFEYQVVFSDATQPNIYFCMIPMQETGIGRSGLIEVGSNVQGHVRNPRSPYRKRFYVPMERYADGKWHEDGFDFDFRQTPGAFYSILAPRINEGCSEPARAELLVSSFKVYAFR
jgi:hypothetical protein